MKFGSINAASYTVNSATQITATSPAAGTAGTVDVTVTTPSGTSATSTADQFTYLIIPTTSTAGMFRGSSGVFYLASSNTAGGGTVNAFNFGMNDDQSIAATWA